jgi:hypothetical protein
MSPQLLRTLRAPQASTEGKVSYQVSRMDELTLMGPSSLGA